MTTYDDLFNYLDQESDGGKECDHTLRLTKKFAKRHKLDFDALSEVLQQNGGFCDCEVLLNVEGRVDSDESIEQE